MNSNCMLSRFSLLGALLMGIVFGLTACTAEDSAKFDAAAKAKVVQEATQALNAYYENICKEGLLSEFAYLDSSKDFHWLPPGSNQEMDFDTVAAAIRKNAAALDTICVTWTSLEVTAIAMDTAGYVGGLHSWSIGVNGDTSEVDLMESGLLIRRGDRWRLLSGKTEVMGN